MPKSKRCLRGNQTLEGQVKQAAELDQLLTAAADSVGKAIQDSIVASIDAAITGADNLNESLKQIASTLLQDIGMMLIRAGLSKAVWRLNAWCELQVQCLAAV